MGFWQELTQNFGSLSPIQPGFVDPLNISYLCFLQNSSVCLFHLSSGESDSSSTFCSVAADCFGIISSSFSSDISSSSLSSVKHFANFQLTNEATATDTPVTTSGRLLSSTSFSPAQLPSRSTDSIISTIFLSSIF